EQISNRMSETGQRGLSVFLDRTVLRPFITSDPISVSGHLASEKREAPKRLQVPFRRVLIQRDELVSGLPELRDTYFGRQVATFSAVHSSRPVYSGSSTFLPATRSASTSGARLPISNGRCPIWAWLQPALRASISGGSVSPAMTMSCLLSSLSLI